MKRELFFTAQKKMRRFYEKKSIFFVLLLTKQNVYSNIIIRGGKRATEERKMKDNYKVNIWFALFNETQLAYTFGQAKLIDNHGTSLIGTYEKSQAVSLGLNPGMIAFVNNHIAIEVNVGMLGLKYNHTEQIHNQVYTGDLKSSQINFMVNILSIGFGVSYYL